MVIILQYIQISNHHDVVHPKLIEYYCIIPQFKKKEN